MKKTEVININSGEPYDIYIGRAGRGEDGYFGNPFNSGSRKEKIESFRQYAVNRINEDKEYREKVKNLYGKRLGCFCKPQACHGDILAELAKQIKIEEDFLS